MKSKILGLLAVGLLAGPMAVQATVISQTLEITGSNFTLFFGSAAPAPVDPLTINFSVTFDNAASFDGTTVGLTVNSFNLPYAVEFAYRHTDDLLTLATNAGTGSCGNPANSFCIFVQNFSLATANATFVQQSTNTGGFWVAQDSTTRIVPEPGTLALLGLGLLGLGFTRRRDRQAAKV